MTATLPLQPAAPQVYPAAIRETLSRLARLSADRPIVLSVYVALGVQDRIRNRYRIAVRDALRQLAEAAEPLGLSHQERAVLARDIERVREYLEEPAGLPHAQGAVLFVAGAMDLFEAMPLPRVLQTRALLGPRPRLAEALATLEDAGRVVMAAVDRAHSRFFEVTPFTVRELAGLVQPTTRGGKFHSDREDAPGWGEHHFHHRIREERHRRAAEVARHLAELVGSGPCQGIVIGGPAKTLAEQVQFLPHELAARLIGAVRINPTAVTPADIQQAVGDAREAAARRRERAVVEELEGAVGTGWGVNGAAATLRALAKGQVRQLLIPDGQRGAGFRCLDTGRLALNRGECRAEGGVVPVPDLVSEVIDEALSQRVEIEIITDPEARERVDGLGALLRFR